MDYTPVGHQDLFQFWLLLKLSKTDSFATNTTEIPSNCKWVEVDICNCSLSHCIDFVAYKSDVC